MRTSRGSSSAEAIIKTLRGAGEPGSRLARGAGRSRAIRGSTSMSATVSITITARGTTTCRCRSRACSDYIERVKAGESLERPVEKLQAERQQLIADYRELLGSDEERAAYDQMITLAHRVFPYVEGHKFYCEHWYTNLFFNKIREFGALLAAHGFFPHARMCFSSRTTSWSRRSSI